jgi:phosphatidyl-myo-inositol dimannoside synthase
MSPPKRILVLTHEFAPYPGGVARFCWNVAAAGARAGHEVTVLAPEHAHHIKDGRQDPPGARVTRFAGDVCEMGELRALERRVQAAIEGSPWDVVHAADWPMILAMRNVPPMTATWVASLHGSDLLVLRDSFRARLAGAHRALARFHRLVCNSAYTARLLKESFPKRSSGDVRVAALGVDPWWFESPSELDLQSFRDTIEQRPGERIVLTVARLDTRKGHLATLAALGGLPSAERVKIKYVCVGRSVDDAYRDRILATATRHGVNTVLTGALSDAQVRAAYKTADVLALCGQSSPKKIEGFGLVLLEAAAQGLPAVVTKVHAIPEVVREEHTGWACHEGDLEQLTAAFRRALGESVKAAMRSTCIEHARSFSWDRCANLTYDFRGEQRVGRSNRCAP